MKRSIREPVLKQRSNTRVVSARIPSPLLDRVRRIRRKAEKQGRSFNVSSIVTQALEEAAKSAEAELKTLSRQHFR